MLSACGNVATDALSHVAPDAVELLAIALLLLSACLRPSAWGLMYVSLVGYLCLFRSRSPIDVVWRAAQFALVLASLLHYTTSLSLPPSTLQPPERRPWASGDAYSAVHWAGLDGGGSSWARAIDLLALCLCCARETLAARRHRGATGGE